jgi:hypothetical protein
MDIATAMTNIDMADWQFIRDISEEFARICRVLRTERLRALESLWLSRVAPSSIARDRCRFNGNAACEECLNRAQIALLSSSLLLLQHFEISMKSQSPLLDIGSLLVLSATARSDQQPMHQQHD